MKKFSKHLLSKNKPVWMCMESWCVRLGSLCEGGGIVWNNLKGGETEKRGVIIKILKRACKLG